MLSGKFIMKMKVTKRLVKKTSKINHRLSIVENLKILGIYIDILHIIFRMSYDIGISMKSSESLVTNKKNSNWAL